MGDCHGSQSDGETAATGIETSLNGQFRYSSHACLQPACSLIALLVEYESCCAHVCLAMRLSMQRIQTSLYAGYITLRQVSLYVNSKALQLYLMETLLAVALCMTEQAIVGLMYTTLHRIVLHKADALPKKLQLIDYPVSLLHCSSAALGTTHLLGNCFACTLLCIKVAGHLSVHEAVILHERMHTPPLFVLLRSAQRYIGMKMGWFLIPYRTGD